MKIVLKRRKHRNGVKPTRKGSLKVRIIDLPTQEEQDAGIKELIKIVDTAGPTYRGYFALLKVNKMQDGYGYFRQFKQIDLKTFAITAAKETDIHFEKPVTTCDSCEYKDGGCPYIRLAGDRKKSCSYFRLILPLPKPKELTTSEMAAYAVQHLS
jgi:hypothetical protein